MKNIRIVAIALLMFLFAACDEDVTKDQTQLQSTINDLNGEVIHYIDLLEEKDQEIKALSQENEELKTELQQIKQELQSFEDERVKPLEQDQTKSNQDEQEAVIKGVGINEGDNQKLISINLEGHLVRLLDSEEMIPYDQLLINNTTVETYTKGNSQHGKVKKISNRDFSMELISDDGETFFVNRFDILGSKYTLGNGLRVGDSVEEIEKICREMNITSKIYNDGVFEAYELKVSKSRMFFEINNSIITSIQIEVEKL